MSKIAIIGGTGLQQLVGFVSGTETKIETPYGQAQVWQGTFANQPVVFLTRHGKGHKLPPHLINYRANIWALQMLNVTDIFAVAAVGGIHRDMLARHLVIPHQLIDYTWGRGHTFFEENNVQHIDFTEPYSIALRQYLQAAAQQYDFVTHTHGVYGATQGPRLETAAEIERMARDGCDIVGMTGMPEAALARELGLNYACCAVIANAAAGRGEGEITMSEIEAHLSVGMGYVQQVLQQAVTLYASNIVHDCN
jgi:5'-methylthioinosine phosphorylase